MNDNESDDERAMESPQDWQSEDREIQDSSEGREVPDESGQRSGVALQKWQKSLGIAFIAALSLLGMTFYVLLYCSHRGYLLWAANRLQAEDEVRRIQAAGQRERTHQAELLEEEKKRHLQEKQNILADSQRTAAELKKANADLARLEAEKTKLDSYLSSRDEEVALLDGLKKQVRHLQEVEGQLRKDIEAQKVLKAQLESRNSMLKQQETVAGGALDALRKKQTEIEERISESKVLTDEVRNLENRIKGHRMTIGHLAEEKKLVDGLRDELAGLQKQRDSLKQDIQERALAKARLESESQRLQDRCGEAAGKLKASQESYKSIQGRIAETKVLTDLVQNLEIQIKQKKASFDSVEKEKQLVDHLRQDIRKLGDDKERLQQEIATAAVQKARLASENAHLKDHAAEIEKQIADLNKQYLGCQEKIAESKILVEEVKKLESQLARRQDLLRQLNENKERLNETIAAERQRQAALAARTEQARELQAKAEEQLKLENQALSETQRAMAQMQVERKALDLSLTELKTNHALLKRNSTEEFQKYNECLKDNGSLQQGRLKLLEEIGEAKTARGRLAAEIALLGQQKKELTQELLDLRNLRLALQGRLQADMHPNPGPEKARSGRPAAPEGRGRPADVPEAKAGR